MKIAAGTTLKAKALLFDMDGTLVNSKAAVEISWQRFAEKHQLDFQEIMVISHGRRTEEIVAHFLPNDDIQKEAEIVTADEIAEIAGVVEIAGARQLLTALPKDRWAVVTSAGRELFESRMAAAGLPLPDVIITAENVSIGKPDPEGYLSAAAKLGFSANECIVFEDAPAGIQAGQQAGAKVVALATELDEKMLDKQDYLLDYQAVKLMTVNEAEGITLLISE